MPISQQSIDDIRNRADIADEIGSRLALKRTGDNLVGLCPFHAEKTPSFSVSISKQFFHCFGCGKSGDVFQFLMDHDGMQFHEAVRDVGERMGLKVEEEQTDQEIRQAQVKRRAALSLEDVCETASNFYKKELIKNHLAQAYIDKRGFSAEILQEYGIGYAPNPTSRTGLSAAFRDYAAPELIEAGLVLYEPGRFERYDRFRGRLMFPIRNVRGRCIGFGARALGDEKPKYLNSPETEIFVKHKVLYGLHEARAHITTKKLAYVVEGYTDVVSMAQHGIGNTVASLGTAFTDDHLRMLFRFTDKVCFVFDGDAPGRAAAEKALKTALPLLEPRHSLTFLTLPNGLDPDDYLRQQGTDNFLIAAQSAPTLSQYLMQLLLERFGRDGKLLTAEAKTQFDVEAKSLCELIGADNPLKEFIAQEIDAVMGRLRPLNVAPSMPAAIISSPAQPVARKWLSKDEWIKQRNAREGRVTDVGFYGIAASPSLDTKTIWQHILNAITIAPAQALEYSRELYAILDDCSTEENEIIRALDRCHKMKCGKSTHAEDEFQSAVDLLIDAPNLILKKRRIDIGKLLDTMKKSNEISDDEYIARMVELMAS